MASPSNDGPEARPKGGWTPEQLIGRSLGGKIVVEGYSGGGGMGLVYSAFHKVLGKTVAVKVLKRPDHPQLAERFFREARMSSRINHPNVVQVYDLGEDGGLLYIVMEYLEGESLEQRIQRHAPMAESRIAEVMCQVLAALASAHDEGIIHRDLKPGNVMLIEKISDEGELIDFVKLLDFGLAKAAETKEEEALTRKGAVVGTPAYMSPEQVIGGRLDGRSDLYACGMIMYEMATGRLPFSLSEPNEVMLWHVNEPPPPPSIFNSRISTDLEFVINWALEKRSELRCPSARELRESLKGLMPKDDPFELRTVLDLNQLRRSVARGPVPKETPKKTKDTEELDVVVLNPDDTRDPSRSSVEIVVALTNSTPPAIPLPSDALFPLVVGVEEAKDPAETERAGRAPSDVETVDLPESQDRFPPALGSDPKALRFDSTPGSTELDLAALEFPEDDVAETQIQDDLSGLLPIIPVGPSAPASAVAGPEPAPSQRALETLSIRNERAVDAKPLSEPGVVPEVEQALKDKPASAASVLAALSDLAELTDSNEVAEAAELIEQARKAEQTPTPNAPPVASPAAPRMSSKTRELAMYLQEQYGVVYSGPPAQHPFWIRDQRGESLGPLKYDQLMFVFVRLLLSGVGQDAWFSSNAVSWVKAKQFVTLTAQEALFDREMQGTTDLSGKSRKLAFKSYLTETSVAAVLARIERERLTGKAVFFDSVTQARVDIEVVCGRMTFVYTNDLSMQLPALLWHMEVVKQESLPGLVHAALSQEVPLEHLIGREIELSKLRRMLMGERLVRLLGYTRGEFGFDEDHWPSRGEPVLGTIMSYLPRLITSSGISEKLGALLEPKLGRSVISIEAPGDDLRPEERAVMERLPTVSTLKEVFSDVGVRSLELATVYVLLEAGLLTLS